jgi:hypothetical protein
MYDKFLTLLFKKEQKDEKIEIINLENCREFFYYWT